MATDARFDRIQKMFLMAMSKSREYLQKIK